MRNEIKWYVHVVIGRQFAIPFQVTRKSDYSLILVLGIASASCWVINGPRRGADAHLRTHSEYVLYLIFIYY